MNQNGGYTYTNIHTHTHSQSERATKSKNNQKKQVSTRRPGDHENIFLISLNKCPASYSKKDYIFTFK